VEFGANNNTQQHVLGVSQLPAGCPPLSCADTSQDFTTIGYAFVLDAEGQITISLGGRNVGAFGTYGPTDRFRVSLAETLTGTARITFGRVTAFCTSGGVCSVDPLYTAEVRATYPLRVDTSFLDENSRLTDVRVVYIK
jgi:hypothetical protein